MLWTDAKIERLIGLHRSFERSQESS